MLEGSVLATILKFAGPTVLVIVAQVMVGVAETFYVSYLGTAALADVVRLGWARVGAPTRSAGIETAATAKYRLRFMLSSRMIPHDDPPRSRHGRLSHRPRRGYGPDEGRPHRLDGQQGHTTAVEDEAKAIVFGPVGAGFTSQPSRGVIR
jgi:hypothetical protein